MKKQARILFVMDDEGFRDLCIKQVRDSGVDFVELCAVDAASAFDVLSEGDAWPDLVITSELPGQSSSEGMVAVDLDDWSKGPAAVIEFVGEDTPVLVFTGGGSGLGLQWVRAGASDVLPRTDVESLGRVVQRQLILGEKAFQLREHAAAQEEERAVLWYAVEAGKVGVWRWDVESNLVRANEIFCDLLNTDHNPDGIPSEVLWFRVCDQDRDRVRSSFTAATEFDGLFESEFRVEGRFGEERYLRALGKSVSGARGSQLMGVLLDVSRQKELEKAVRDAAQHYEKLFNDARDALYETTVEGQVIRFNRAAYELFKIPPDTPASEISVLDLYVDPETRIPMREAMQEHGEVIDWPADLLTTEGVPIESLITARRVYGPEGEVVSYFGSIRDVTSHRRLERERLQGQKLESIGQLAAGVAHEINTPIQYAGDNLKFMDEAFSDFLRYIRLAEGIISGDPAGLSQGQQNLTALKEEIDLDFLVEEVPLSAKQAIEGVDRVAELVAAMKRFSHPGQKEKGAVDLNEAIQSAVTVSRNEWKYVSDMDVDLDPDLPSVVCHLGEVNQVVLNLVVNAGHAIGAKIGEGEKGKITVSTRHVDQWAEIKISDTGCGIPQENLDRVFDPFFTTKAVGKGTGQGLAIAYSVVVDKHGGELNVDSEIGVGTTFTIRLPLAGTDINGEKDSAPAIAEAIG